MNELIEVKSEDLVTIFSNASGLDPILEQVKEFVGSFEHDLSTAAGRKRTASLAARVAKLKVKVDGTGKDVCAEWKAKAKKVDASRKAWRDEMDALKIEARKPLTEWEEEQKRIEEEKAEAERIERERVEVLRCHDEAIALNKVFNMERAEAARLEAERIEKERVEKDRLQAERDERIHKEAEEKARQEAQQKIIDAEKAKEEAERAKIVAEEKAKQDEIDRKVAAERAASEAIEREKAIKLKAEEDAKKAALEEAKRIEREKAAREADIEHRETINRTALEDLVAAGVDQESAEKAIIAIAIGLVRSVKINY